MAIPTQGQDGAAPTSAAPSWRQRLEGKQRRRLEVPILVSDDDHGLMALSEQQEGLVRLLEAGGADPAALAEAQAKFDVTREALSEHIAKVPFVTLPGDEYDALLAAHPATELSQDGGIEWTTALPALAAACSAAAEDRPCGDEDITWWSGILARPEWTKGDLLNLWGTLLRLHQRAPSARVPFA
jgi:hypothetical protein